MDMEGNCSAKRRKRRLKNIGRCPGIETAVCTASDRIPEQDTNISVASVPQMVLSVF